MNNKALAKILRKAIKDSEVSVPVYDRINGFEVKVGTRRRYQGNVLAQKIETLASTLEELE